MIKIIASLLVTLLILADIPKSFAESDNPKSHCGIFILDNCNAESGFNNSPFGLTSAEIMKNSIQRSINNYTKNPALIYIGKMNDEQMNLTYLDDKNNKISVSNCMDLGNLAPDKFSNRVVDFLNKELILSKSITHFIIPIVNSRSGATTLILFEKTGKFVTMGRARGDFYAAGMQLAGNIKLCENSILKAQASRSF